MKTLEMIISEAWPGWQPESRIGSGAFGEVYRIFREDAAGRSSAAVKIIRLQMQDLRSLYASEEETRTAMDQMMNRISREIQVMKSLKGQSHLVSIDDYQILEDDEDGTRWVLIRMELLTPLLVDLDIHAYGEDRLIRMGIDLCRGLEVCARERIVHRDIKPENIFVNQQGDYKLGDFSVARTLDTVREKVTEWDFVRGERFTAPEVKNGLMREMNFDEACRTDIYSLGMVLYWIANGQRLPFLPEKSLFSSSDREEAERRRLRGDPLPGLPGVSTGLQEVLLKACAFESEKRYADAASFRHALEALRSGETQGEAGEAMKGMAAKDSRSVSSGTAGSPYRPRRRRWIPLLAAALALALFAALWLNLPVPVTLRYVTEEGDFLAAETVSLLPGQSRNLTPDGIPEGYVPQGASLIRVSADLLRRVQPAPVTFKCREANFRELPNALRFDMVLYPHRYAIGLPFSFLGTVSSDVPLTEVVLNLYTEKETFTQRAEIPPDAMSYDLKNLGDAALRKLGEGRFYIEFQAADASGKRIGFSHTCEASVTFPEHNIYDFTRTYMEPELKGSFVYGGHTYEIYHHSGIGWDVDAAFARGKGGYLAVLADAEEFNIVASYCLGMGLKYLNVGLQKNEEGWNWVDGTPFVSGTWNPTALPDEDCPYPPVGSIVNINHQWYFGKATQFEMSYFIMEYDFEAR